MKGSLPGRHDKKRILLVATYGGFFTSFETGNIRILQNMGYEVHIASNFSYAPKNEKPEQMEQLGIAKYQIPFRRGPFSLHTVKNYYTLLQLIENLDPIAVHCHNPVCGIIVRLAAAKASVPVIFYTAHGFHFFKGCPPQNRIYELAEKRMARYTDALITINREDYLAAEKWKIRGKTYEIPGAGIDLSQFRTGKGVHKSDKRQELGIPEEALMILSVGELNRNKNHKAAIRAFKESKLENSYYVICGEGNRRKELEKMIGRLHLQDRVRLLGYRTDVKELLSEADIFVLPSFREGLPTALMEAMASGVICIASKIRGNVDLLGAYPQFLFNPGKYKELRQALKEAAYGDREKIGYQNRCTVQKFSIEEVDKKMRKIYEEVLELDNK